MIPNRHKSECPGPTDGHQGPGTCFQTLSNPKKARRLRYSSTGILALCSFGTIINISNERLDVKIERLSCERLSSGRNNVHALLTHKYQADQLMSRFKEERLVYEGRGVRI